MKQLEEGFCFGTKYDSNSPECTKECYISFACSLKTKGIRQSDKIEKRTPENFNRIHTVFINRLTDLFPRMQNELFENLGVNIGAVHEYFNANGDCMCRIHTRFPEYCMKIDVINHEIFTMEPLSSENECEALYQKIKVMN